MGIIDLYGERIGKYSDERLLNEYNFQFQNDPDSIRTIYCAIELKHRGLSMNVPNTVTSEAIVESRQIAKDESAKGYTTMDELKAALNK